ncbi:unnamed protein product [Meganyctiphanes norvegica]|uniref:Uncharacterized protein n=1 Tax=Meganyctiphanes norvegica TaxID=48144 RepID=A0AAV2PMY9_MEGNR
MAAANSTPPLTLCGLEEGNITFKSDMRKGAGESKFLGVWIKGGRVFKLRQVKFGDKKKIKTRVEHWNLTNRAINSGVHTPTMVLEPQGVLDPKEGEQRLTWYDENGKSYKVLAEVTNELSAKNGMFFHLAKGHVTPLAKLVNTCDKAMRNIVLEAVDNAIKFNLSDPQGFFSPDGVGGGVEGPIAFIDIHQSTTPDGKLTTLRNEINTN